MKKYIVKGLCLLLLLIGTDFAVGKFFSCLHGVAFRRSPYGFVTEYALYSVNTDVVVIGSSRACRHYVPEILSDSLGLTVHNCGKDGSFFWAQCCVIDGILNRTTPELIIWDVEPGCLADDLSASSRLSDLNPFYDDSRFCREVIGRSSPVEKYKMWSRTHRYNSRLLAYLYKSVVPFAYPEDGYLPLADAGYQYPVLIKQDEKDGLRKESVAYVETIVKKCKTGGVNLILSFSPRFTKDHYFETESYQKLCRIAEQENVPLIDFYHDAVFMGDSTLFNDNAHLNDRGARLFTRKWLGEYVKQLSYDYFY